MEGGFKLCMVYLTRTTFTFERKLIWFSFSTFFFVSLTKSIGIFVTFSSTPPVEKWVKSSPVIWPIGVPRAHTQHQRGVDGKWEKINFKNKKNNTRNWITIRYSHTVAVCRHWLFAIHINRFLDFRFHSQSHFPFRYIQINEINYFFILPYSDIILKIHISVSSIFFQGTLTSNWEISYRNRIDIVCF